MKKTLTITISEDTQKRLNFLCDNLGLRKSQAIAFAINTIVMEKYKYDERGENNEEK